MQQDEKNGQARPEAYPKPTEVDHQLKSQDEYNEERMDARVAGNDTADELKEANERMKGTASE